MQTATVYKAIFAVVLFFVWIFVSVTLTQNPNLTTYMITFSLGMLTVVAIIIQLVLKKDIQTKMKGALNAEITERKGKLQEEITNLSIYLEEEKIPNFSESGLEELSDDFREFDSIKSRYNIQPKIIHVTLLIILASLILFVFWANPTFFTIKPQSPSASGLSLAMIGVGIFCFAVWIILNIFVDSLEIKVWEKEDTSERNVQEAK